MKKILFIYIIAAFLTGCGSYSARKSTLIDKEKRSGWINYSTALFYQNQQNYKTALQYLNKAAEANKDLDRVYYQMAYSYYRLFDYALAKKYSERSISENPDFLRPYLLLYDIYMNLNNPSQAAQVLDLLIKNKNGSINIYYMLGTIYYSKLKKWDKAQMYFEKILEKSKSVFVDNYYLEYSHYYLGHIFYSRGLVNRTIEHFRRCSEINPDNFTVLYMLAILHMEYYQIDDAQRYALRYLTRFPDNVKINSIMGRIEYLKGNHASIDYLRKAKDSKTFDGYLAKSLYLEMIHRDTDSVELLKKLIRENTALISPHIALAATGLRTNNKSLALSEYFTAGILLYRARIYDKARECLYKALSINEKIPQTYFYLARIYEETDNQDQALLHYKKALNLSKSTEILIHLGYLYSTKKNFSEATRYLDRAIELQPKNSRGYFFKGLIYTKMDNYTDAEKLLRQAISLNEKNHEYYYYLATVLDKQKKLDETILQLKKAIKYNPKSAKSYNFLGYLYADNNIKLDESIILIKKALEYEPTNGAYLDSLGWAYFRKRNYSLALEKLLEAEQMLEKDKNPDPVVYDHIGDTYKEIGNIKKALEYWNKSNNLKKDKIIEYKIKHHRAHKSR